jgi:hypothetical protein
MTDMTWLAIVTLLAATPAVGPQEGRPDPAASGQTFAVAGAEQQKPVPPPPPPPPPPAPVKRRGSFVGYIDDAVVGTKVRVRFEWGLQNQVPDRAEFFYAKCGCYQDLDESDDLFDPEAPGPRPGAALNLNFQQVFVQGEFAISDRVSVFAEFPVRWIQPKDFQTDGALGGLGGEFPNQGGIGDIRGGVKAEVVSTPVQVVSLQVRAYLPTGPADKGLGTNHATIEPALLMYHRIGERGSIESQVGLWYPLGGSDGLPITSEDKFSGPVLYYGIGPSVDVYQSSRVRFGPVVELVGWHILSGLQTVDDDDEVGIDASGINIINIKFGARVTWNDTNTIYGGWGRALTDQQWYRDLFRFEYRRTF